MNEYKELCERSELSWGYIDELRAAIEQLVKYAKLCEAECADAERYVKQLVKERDAAVESIKQCWLCASCKKRIRGNEWASCKNFKVEVLVVKGDKSYTCKNWEWRGVQNADS